MTTVMMARLVSASCDMSEIVVGYPVTARSSPPGGSRCTTSRTVSIWRIAAGAPVSPMIPTWR